jgi:GNAT superfamily N-acetyltransferase
VTATVTVAPLPPEQRADAVGVLARGMRDNPLHVAVYGDDPELRVARLTAAFEVVMGHQADALRAEEHGTVVGTCGVGAEEPCSIGCFRDIPRERFPAMSDDPAVQDHIHEWLTTWGAHDPIDQHLHLGPVAADAGRQGEGIGTAMMTAFCDRADGETILAYLETDKPENVRFYERFGFETVGEDTVVGIPNWFMRREAR